MIKYIFGFFVLFITLLIGYFLIEWFVIEDDPDFYKDISFIFSIPMLCWILLYETINSLLPEEFKFWTPFRYTFRFYLNKERWMDDINSNQYGGIFSTILVNIIGGGLLTFPILIFCWLLIPWGIIDIILPYEYDEILRKPIWDYFEIRLK